MKKVVIPLFLILILAGVGTVLYFFYPYIFAKTVSGKILKVERVSHPEAIITSSAAKKLQQYPFVTFAVSVIDSKGEIHTGSGDDKQWAVVQKDQCAQVKFLPYPPWVLDKSGTFYGARLLHLYECTKDGTGTVTTGKEIDTDEALEKEHAKSIQESSHEDQDAQESQTTEDQN
ncbi:MAG: hypothetical protein AB7F43_13965 [Bacteriovoracia bacterium]